MTYEETEARRLELINLLQDAEKNLYNRRNQTLPMKDADRFSSELARKTYMEAQTSTEQALVDGYIRELEVIADRTKLLVAVAQSSLPLDVMADLFLTVKEK